MVGHNKRGVLILYIYIYRLIYNREIFVFTFSLDTYMSHEGVIYCKPHHKELFQPKAVIMDILDEKRDSKAKKTQEIIGNNLRIRYLILISKKYKILRCTDF